MLRDSIWNGRLQRMVFSNGTPKRICQVLTEMGVDTRCMKADNMNRALGEMSDFTASCTQLKLAWIRQKVTQGAIVIIASLGLKNLSIQL